MSFFFLLSCGKKKDNPTRLVFGTFYKSCTGRCVKMYGLCENYLSEDDTVSKTSFSAGYSYLPMKILSGDKFNIAEELLYNVPKQLLVNSGRPIGTPDSHGQGGMYIEVETEFRGAYMIDMDDSPDQTAELRAFKKKVLDVMRQIEQ